jgi:hypothetical protein
MEAIACFEPCQQVANGPSIARLLISRSRVRIPTGSPRKSTLCSEYAAESWQDRRSGATSGATSYKIGNTAPAVTAGGGPIFGDDGRKFINHQIARHVPLPPPIKPEIVSRRPRPISSPATIGEPPHHGRSPSTSTGRSFATVAIA